MKRILTTLVFVLCLSPAAGLPFVADGSKAYSDRYLDPRMYVPPYGSYGPGPTAPSPRNDDYQMGHGRNVPPIPFGPRGSDIGLDNSNTIINGRPLNSKNVFTGR
jgi:hypothetical protein